MTLTRDVAPESQADLAPKPPASAKPDAAVARVERLSPNDADGLANLVLEQPRARTEILAAAASRMGNAVVQSALAKTADQSRLAVQTATQFYTAFASRDAATMAAAYAPTVSFHDPLFGSLHGSQVMLMWNSIMPKADPFHIVPTVGSTAIARGDDTFEVHVTWAADYGLGGRAIHNQSSTTLLVQRGKIIQQRDEWDLKAWTAQALPMRLGGNAVADAITAAAAHSYVEVLDLIHKHRG
ncbi:MAG: nuclear transport factor 2 family protein [Deltaproteobacteria bacterium]